MKILKYKKFTGLHIVCKKCGRHIEVSQDEYKGCNHPIDRQKYKAIVSINGARKTRDLQTLDYDTAVKKVLEFKEELLNPVKLSIAPKEVESKPILFKDCIMMYSDWLENVDVPFFERKIRRREYIRDTIGYICKLKDYLQKNTKEELSVFNVDKNLVNSYFEELYKKSKSISTYNHNIRANKGFYKFLIETKGYELFNPMAAARLKNESPNPINASDTDFDKILRSCSSDNSSIHTYKNGVRKKMYRPYIKEAFEIIAYTGMRNTEAISIKYSDIVLDENGELDYVIGVDLKYEKTHNYDQSKPTKIVPIPYSPELEDLLNRLDYKKHLGEDRYLIGPDENITRDSMAKLLSHSFKFYRDKCGITTKIGLKHLRKSFLTKIEAQTGLVESLGYQKTKRVIQNNYLVKPEIARAVKQKGFRLFKKEDERNAS
ncbi:site-specific recombinase XerD [Flavobacterium aciduliphilum]|uniref:Site-specific recombinase XerD n=1 Tax=Flavobacterium aciduliphilum TaxID=1101402 RepID=A0A328YHG5_9FLAO|nr:site-specific recombinase XerD [Flavobacterium aciduliphilum]